MHCHHAKRSGLTLIEILVVIAIVAVLFSLLLVGIQKVREAAVLSQNKNNLRQIILGIHQIASEREGRIENLMTATMPFKSTATDRSLFYRLLPYVHGATPQAKPGMSGEELHGSVFPRVAVYRNPADPTWDLIPGLAHETTKCSYAYNILTLADSFGMVPSLPDGTSQTLALADKYFSSDTKFGETYICYDHLFDPTPDMLYYGRRRATFADKGWNDVIPVVDRISRTAKASIPGRTFQVRPRMEDVDPRLLQSTFSAGLTVAMFDGSIRSLNPTISESVFWGMVTPNAGEVISVD